MCFLLYQNGIFLWGMQQRMELFSFNRRVNVTCTYPVLARVHRRLTSQGYRRQNIEYYLVLAVELENYRTAKIYNIVNLEAAMKEYRKKSIRLSRRTGHCIHLQPTAGKALSKLKLLQD